MNPIDEINLQAFLDALAKLDRPLDVSVQQKLKQLASKLADDEPITMAKYVSHLSKIYAHALEVFDDSTTVWSWLNRPNRSLGGAVPLELLETEAGSEQVDTILGRIEYGVYS